MPEPRTAGAEGRLLRFITEMETRGHINTDHAVQAVEDVRELRAALAHAERERDAAQKLAVEVEEALVAEMHVVARDSGQYRLCSDLLRAMYREVVRKRLAAAPPPAEGGER